MSNATRWVICLVSAGVFACSGQLYAQSTKDKEYDDERKAAAAEDEAEEQMNITEKVQKLHTEFTGIFAASQEDDNPEVVGSMQAEYTESNGAKASRSFLVKLQDPSLLKKLQHYDKKRVQVQGKIRNEGKYLVITQIRELAPGAPRAERRMSGGI